MKIPARAPVWKLEDIHKYLKALPALHAAQEGPTVGRRYIHWDKLRRLPTPIGVTSDQWWWYIKLLRSQLLKPVALKDSSNNPFHFSLPDPAGELLHHLDRDAAGRILVSDEVTNPGTRDRYVISSLMEEAITSSQLEGAATTRVIAKEMLRTGRQPRDRSEQMIANNYTVMRRIQSMKDESLTPALVIELQRMLTEGVIDDPSAAGRLRKTRETVHVVDAEGQILHTPPPADELEQRVLTMCEFANQSNVKDFIHPVIRSIMLHFWLAYDHPFVDGNGRCARALFYWSMLRSGYWLCEFISISQLIRKAPIQYGRAFLYTETDSNDLTYFIFYHLELVRKSIDEFTAYLKRKMTEARDIQRTLLDSQRYNHRQLALLGHAMRNPDAWYSFASHQTSHNIVYETARKDLSELAKMGLLMGSMRGRTFIFTPAAKLESRMKELN